MFLGKNQHEAYWNSYRLLESQLLRLSHSICFDDNQINVYSSELADIINSACIKIESLAKDIYEDHIWPFQEDKDEVPPSNTSKNFKPEKWTRENWKFDYNCLVEIDHRAVHFQIRLAKSAVVSDGFRLADNDVRDKIIHL